jgi:hypothetical protein
MITNLGYEVLVREFRVPLHAKTHQLLRSHMPQCQLPSNKFPKLIIVNTIDSFSGAWCPSRRFARMLEIVGPQV